MGPQVDCEDHSCTKFCFVTKTLGEVSGVALCVPKSKFAKQTLLLTLRWKSSCGEENPDATHLD